MSMDSFFRVHCDCFESANDRAGDAIIRILSWSNALALFYISILYFYSKFICTMLHFCSTTATIQLNNLTESNRISCVKDNK